MDNEKQSNSSNKNQNDENTNVLASIER